MNGKELQLTLVRGVREGIGAVFRRARLSRVPIVPNRIFFSTYQNDYTCNCKYIAEKLLEKAPGYELVFSVSRSVCENRGRYGIPDEIRLVERYSGESFLMQASAGFWIDNGLNCIWKKVPKRSGQIYINTWHGSLGIKRLDGSWHWRIVARYGNRKIDYFLTNSRYDEKVFSESFWPAVRHLKLGHPRNDLLFDKGRWDGLRQKIYARYGLAPEVRTILYAPTFREGGESAPEPDFRKIADACAGRFGGSWRIMSRCHYRDVGSERSIKPADAKSLIEDVSDYPDIQELMAAADIGITDYSSWIFDFIFTGKPAFLYVKDRESYANRRGFYYSLEETPFPIADNSAQLCVNIRQFDNTVYRERCRDFLEARGCYETGDASERVVAFIREHTRK